MFLNIKACIYGKLKNYVLAQKEVEPGVSSTWEKLKELDILRRKLNGEVYRGEKNKNKNKKEDLLQA